MGTRDPRVDAYIAKARPFARPVLVHFRKLVHKACPGAEETLKWGAPHFDYKGIMCGMAAFKAHCAVIFWKAALLPPGAGIEKKKGAMGHLGRITSLKDLPPERTLLGWIAQAAALNDQGVKLPARTRKGPPAPVKVPAYFMAALRKEPRALETFKAFSPSHKREYVEWVTEAKTEETRLRRLATSVEWMGKGKARNWRYVRR